jgi:hypothetical protein
MSITSITHLKLAYTPRPDRALRAEVGRDRLAAREVLGTATEPSDSGSTPSTDATCVRSTYASVANWRRRSTAEIARLVPHFSASSELARIRRGTGVRTVRD